MTSSASGLLISVVVPTHNRLASLTACLLALVEQELPRDRYEVIVVDDGSRTPPRELIAELSSRMSVRLIEQQNAGPASARNTGARAARGQLLAFTDDDCRAAPTWLSTLVSAMNRTPHSAIGGPVLNALPDNGYSAASQLLVDYLYSYHNTEAVHGQFFVTSNVAFPVDAFRALNGFDVSFPLAAAEDRDFCERWRNAQHTFVFDPDAIVYHAHRLTLRRFCRQHFTYGRGARYLQLARATRGDRSLRIEPAKFYWNMLRFPFATQSTWRACKSATLLAISQVMYAAGYARERAQHGMSKRRER